MVLIPTIFFITGTLFGSFVNVLVLRFIHGGNVVSGRSACPHCKHVLQWYELVPVVSYVVQRGRCRKCKKNISRQYPAVEIATGAVFALLFLPVAAQLSLLPLAIAGFAIVSLLIVLFVIDLKTFILPDFYIVVLALAVAVYQALQAVPPEPRNALLGVLVGAGFLLVLWLATKGKGLGFGDVKLMIPLGLLFGLQGAVVLLFLAFFIGGIIGAGLLLAKKAGPKTAIPFGPFLAGAGIVLLLYPGSVSIASRYLLGGLL